MATVLAKSELPPDNPLGTKETSAATVPDITEITANSSDFAQPEHRAIFVRDVTVTNPRFHISCDKLTAYLKHQDATLPSADPKPKQKAAPKGWPKPSAEDELAPVAVKNPDDATGGIEKAIAEGNVIITQDKVEQDGSITHSIGHSRKAVYEASTGDIRMTGMPRCEQKDNTCVALADETIIILNRDKEMRAIGPNQMMITHTQAAPARKTSDANTPGDAADNGRH